MYTISTAYIWNWSAGELLPLIHRLYTGYDVITVLIAIIITATAATTLTILAQWICLLKSTDMILSSANQVTDKWAKSINGKVGKSAQLFRSSLPNDYSQRFLLSNHCSQYPSPPKWLLTMSPACQMTAHFITPLMPARLFIADFATIRNQWKSQTTYFAAFCLGLFALVSCSWVSVGNYTKTHHTKHAVETLTRLHIAILCSHMLGTRSWSPHDVERQTAAISTVINASKSQLSRWHILIKNKQTICKYHVYFWKHNTLTINTTVLTNTTVHKTWFPYFF